ncbi:MAG: GreA/GreB family elongation factor [Myxococcota bacterium]
MKRSPPPAKPAVLAALLRQLEQDLEAAKEAQRTVSEGATHEESRPENDKDTRALEASYLARGLAQRVADIAAALAAARGLSERALAPGAPVGAGTLVTLEDDEGELALVFLVPLGGGARLQVAGHEVKVVSPHAPLGEALLGRHVGDDVELRTPRGPRELVVMEVR